MENDEDTLTSESFFVLCSRHQRKSRAHDFVVFSAEKIFFLSLLYAVYVKIVVRVDIKRIRE